MSGEKRDLDYFLNNPGEIPADIEGLDALMAANELGQGGDDDGSQTGEESSAASGAVAGEAATEKTGAQVETKTESEQGSNTPAGAGEQPAAIKSKNGKHEIPYAVLESERAARRNAEQAMATMQQQLAALQQQVQTGVAAPKPAAQQQADAQPDLTQDELAQISEDFPAVGKLLQSMATQVAQLTSQIGAVSQSEQSRQQVEAQRASATVQEAIDANPHLSYWQQKDAAMFATAVQFDNQIKADPRNHALTFDERFEKVVKAIEAVYGATELPAEYRRDPAPVVAAKTTATEAAAAKAGQQQQVAAVAKKAIEQAEQSQQPMVRSLSDIPGGVPPAVDELSQLGEKSASDLGALFTTMSTEQVMSILARAA